MITEVGDTLYLIFRFLNFTICNSSGPVVNKINYDQASKTWNIVTFEIYI